MFWNQQVETLSRVDMTTWQNYKVEKGIERIFEKSSFYKNRMEERGLEPRDIKTVDDLAKIPFTTKQDIGDNYPYGLLTMPVSGISYIHKARDKEGIHTAISYTRNDMTMWTELMSRIAVAGGVNVTSVLQFAAGMEADHLSLCYGAAQIGAALVGSGKEPIKEQLCSIQDFGATTLFSTPSHLLLMAQEARAMQVKLEELPLHTIFSVGQPLTETMRQQLQKEYGVNVLEIYGMDSVFGMGAAGECHCKSGLHIGEDCFYPEVVHPVSGQVLQKGETGELVLTSLVLEAMPLIRYRTGTICHLDENVCACGRTQMRMIKK